jgi:hypothetical protein
LSANAAFVVNTVPVAMSKSETRVVPGTYDNVFRAVCDAARAEAMTLKSAEPGTGLIRLSSLASMATWGENLDVNLRPAASGVEVTIHSSLKFGLVDWGRNRENIEKLFRRVAGLLTATSGAWLPDPSTRHELRWWDGSRWTENVSDSGRPGVDAL